jgi:SAM-dependent methyltransferase
MMDQTPIHEFHNPDLLKLIPIEAKKIIEIGCSSESLARELKKISPEVNYFGIEIDPAYAESALRYCNETAVLDIEQAGVEFWNLMKDRDCWIFGDTLEHLRDPWTILNLIHKALPEGGTIVACIPNVQHWSLQVRLSVGDFRYEKDGLMDRTHLRWFTRQTIVEMFDQAGFAIEAGLPRVFDEPMRERFLPLIAEMEKVAGADPQVAVSDSLPLQYVIRAVKKQ